MNWYYQVILVFMAVNAFVWYGTDLVINNAPEDSIIYNNFSEINSPAQSVLGRFFNTNVGPESDAWLEANQSKLNATVTTESEENVPITSSVLGAFLGAGGTIGYIGGLLNAIGGFFGAMYALLTACGIPTEVSAMFSMLWNMMFLAALVALITGRGS